MSFSRARLVRLSPRAAITVLLTTTTGGAQRLNTAAFLTRHVKRSIVPSPSWWLRSVLADTDVASAETPSVAPLHAVAAAADCEVADGVPPVASWTGDIGNATTSATLWKLALAGAIASFVGDGTMHPLDSIKTWQQSDAGYGLSLWQAAVAIVSGDQGFMALYRGFWSYSISDALGGSLKFATYELAKQTVLSRIEEASNSSLASASETESTSIITTTSTCSASTSTKDWRYNLGLLLCAALAFVASSSVVVPGEYLKQQLQMNYYDSLPQAVAGTLQSMGVFGFYTGYSGVFLRDIPYTMLELGLYDVFKRGLLERKQQLAQQANGKAATAIITLQPWEEVVAAAVTGGITGYVTTPLDTIKTKVMVDHYDNFISCLMQTVDAHGISSVFAGGLARVAWLMPFTAIYLPVYDWAKQKLLSSSSSMAPQQPTPEPKR